MIYTLTLNPSIDYIVHVDEVKLGELNRMKQDFKLPGGKGINVSRILKRLGNDTTALGFLGGFTGDFIQSWIEKENIATNFTSIEADTRINIKLKSEMETEINGLGPDISAEEINQLKANFEQLTADDMVVLSGSIPPSLNANFYEELVEIIRSKGAEFVLDTTGQTLLNCLEKQPFLIKPNHHELAELFNVAEFSSIEELLPYGRKLRTMGAQNVLISMGGDGALFFDESGVYQSNVPKGQLKNSVGAGDSMIAGFVGSYVEEQDALSAFKNGVACGSATAFSDDLATREKIDEIRAQVTIKKIAKA